MTEKIHFLPFSHPLTLSDDEMVSGSDAFYQLMDGRRTIRDYSSKAVDLRVIENCLKAASTAPSGAHKQPWHFAVISDPEMKRKIRESAETEEREFYAGRASDEWIEALLPFGTDDKKPFLETAPYLIAIFAKNYEVMPDNTRSKNYYVQESVGIATGMLIAALHQSGLSTLTHTPSPMGFLNKVLGRPANERAYLLLVVGHPSESAVVPDIERKPLQEFASFV